MKRLRSKAIDTLFQAILQLETVDECYAFFEDICTVKEVQDIAQRLEIAMLLANGKSYQEVTERTNVSSATISRVKRCLEYGSGGYNAAIEKLAAKGAGA